jgi:hypothetical protein
MDVFIGVMIALMLGAGVMQSVSNNGMYPAVHFIFMMITVVGIPILHIVS